MISIWRVTFDSGIIILMLAATAAEAITFAELIPKTKIDPVRGVVYDDDVYLGPCVVCRTDPIEAMMKEIAAQPEPGR